MNWNSTRSLRPLGFGLSLILTAALPACGDGTTSDDDSETGGRKGSGGSAMAGDTGAGGERASGGSSTGSGGKATSSGGDESGVGGDDSAGGSAGEGAGGSSGGSDPGVGGLGGDDGTGGVDGTGGAPPGPLAIERSHEVLLSQVSDIRGLGYAKNGKLYASGFRTDELGDAWVTVLRLLPSGALDGDFGEGGVAEFNLVERVTETSGDPPVTTVLNDGAENSFGVVELASGDVMVQVAARQEEGAGMWVGLIRLDSSGDLVTTFGNDGLVQVPFGYDLSEAGVTPFSDSSWGLALDDQSTEGTEKIVVTGFGTAPAASGRTDNDRYIARVLASDGSLDSGFNGGATFSFHSQDALSDGGRRAIILPGGGILSTGYTNFGTGQGNNVVLIQLTPAGTLDPEFGFGGLGAGVAKFNPFVADGGVAECYAATRQSSGRLVTTGYGAATAANTGSTLGYLTSVRQDMVSFGVLDDGLDATFANSGHLAIQSEDDPPTAGYEALAAERFEERGRDLLSLADDRTVYAGRYDLLPALMVGRKNGGLDETVGDNQTGRFLYDAIPADGAHFFTIAQSSDGSRVAAATNGSPAGVLIAVLRIGDL